MIFLFAVLDDIFSKFFFRRLTWPPSPAAVEWPAQGIFNLKALTNSKSGTGLDMNLKLLKITKGLV